MAGFFSRFTQRPAPAAPTSATPTSAAPTSATPTSATPTSATPPPAARPAPSLVPPRDPGPGLEDLFTQDHRACDELWAEVEAVAGQPEAFRAAFATFDARMRRHFAWEEDVLFPALEKATGMHGMGPTEIMRQEHRQMRGLLDQMTGADPQEVLDQGDTLMMLIQQHNSKEEMMLYPLGEQALHAVWPELRRRLA